MTSKYSYHFNTNKTMIKILCNINVNAVEIDRKVIPIEFTHIRIPKIELNYDQLWFELLQKCVQLKHHENAMISRH